MQSYFFINKFIGIELFIQEKVILNKAYPLFFIHLYIFIY